MPDVIASFDGDYFWLSNFYESPCEAKILGERMRFHSSEAAYQAGKLHACKDNGVDVKAMAVALATCEDPGLSKKLGRKIPLDTAKWDKIKDNHMREVVFNKFLLDSDLCARLMETGATLLVEGNTWGDTYWGRCEGKGLNRLGSILMEVRGYWWWSGRADTYPKTEQEAHILMGW